jgi:hypothetical protein
MAPLENAKEYAADRDFEEKLLSHDDQWTGLQAALNWYYRQEDMNWQKPR